MNKRIRKKRGKKLLKELIEQGSLFGIVADMRAAKPITFDDIKKAYERASRGSVKILDCEETGPRSLALRLRFAPIVTSVPLVIDLP